MKHISESVKLPVSEEIAFNILLDIDVLFRLSPYWSLKELKPLSVGTVREGSRYEATIEYYAKEVTETRGIEFLEVSKDKRVSFRVENGILKEIDFTIERDGDGVQLTQRFLLECEDETVLKGTKNELFYWLRSIGEYLKLAEGKTLRQRLFKWFMDRAWLRLTLSERKIAIIVTKISIVELALLLILIFIWNLFIN